MKFIRPTNTSIHQNKVITSIIDIVMMCTSVKTPCLFCRKEKDRAKANEKKKKDPSELKEREV